MGKPEEMAQEGVIKFDLQFSPAPALPAANSAAIRDWHRRCHQLALIGRDPERYEGLAYGNISQREQGGAFLISGTQTGGEAVLPSDAVCRVDACDIAANRIIASGPVRPSSESLTHAALYQTDPAIGFVIHVHSPLIWHRAEALGLPSTPPEIEYGTPAMAVAVDDCYRMAKLHGSGIIAMAGHEDGILAFGKNAQQAGELLLACFARARELAQSAV